MAGHKIYYQHLPRHPKLRSYFSNSSSRFSLNEKPGYGNNILLLSQRTQAKEREEFLLQHFLPCTIPFRLIDKQFKDINSQTIHTAGGYFYSKPAVIKPLLKKIIPSLFLSYRRKWMIKNQKANEKYMIPFPYWDQLSLDSESEIVRNLLDFIRHKSLNHVIKISGIQILALFLLAIEQECNARFSFNSDE